MGTETFFFQTLLLFLLLGFFSLQRNGKSRLNSDDPINVDNTSRENEIMALRKVEPRMYFFPRAKKRTPQKALLPMPCKSIRIVPYVPNIP